MIINTLSKIKVEFIFKWYDLWAGVYYDRKNKWVYFLPLPTIGIVIKIKPWAGVVKPNFIMKPTIGRVVVYKCSEEEQNLNNHQELAPAIITAVWSDTCVNLKVILDGETTLWKTSAPLGGLEMQWSWPVID